MANLGAFFFLITGRNKNAPNMAVTTTENNMISIINDIRAITTAAKKTQ